MASINLPKRMDAPKTAAAPEIISPSNAVEKVYQQVGAHIANAGKAAADIFRAH